jgi:hypothetical protein
VRPQQVSAFVQVGHSVVQLLPLLFTRGHYALRSDSSGRVCPSASKLMQHTRMLNLNASGGRPSTMHRTEILSYFVYQFRCCMRLCPPACNFQKGWRVCKKLPYVLGGGRLCGSMSPIFHRSASHNRHNSCCGGNKGGRMLRTVTRLHCLIFPLNNSPPPPQPPVLPPLFSSSSGCKRWLHLLRIAL